MTSVRTHLWFGNDKAVEAAHFYAEHIPRLHRHPRGHRPHLPPTTASPTSSSSSSPATPVIGLNAGPVFHLNEAFSFYLSVEGQEEVDHYWDLLTADGGEPGACGWCKDKYGVSWQLIPRELEELSGDYSTEANFRVAQAMLKMGKIDVAEIQAAYDGGA